MHSRKMITEICKYNLILMCIIFMLSGSAYSQSNPMDTVTIYGKTIPRFLDDPIESPFGEFLSHLSQKAELKFIIRLYPARRAKKLFMQGEADILIPFPMAQDNPGQLNQFEKALIHSLPIARLHRHFLTLSTHEIISDPSQLKDKKIGLTQGYEYRFPDILAEENNLVHAVDQASLVRLLYRGRVDAIASFPFEALLIAKNLKLTPPPRHDPNYILSVSNIVMLLHDTERGQGILNKIDTAIKELQKSGEIKRLTDSFHGNPISHGTNF